MRKFFVKLGLRFLDVLGLVALARLINTQMTGNANFTTPDPPLADITTAANKLEASAQKVAVKKQELAEAVAVQNTDAQAIKDVLTDEGKYVDIKAKGDKAIIESAGMQASDEPAPVGEMPQVENLSLTHGDNPGEVDAHWNTVKKKDNYTIQVTADPLGSAPWQTRGNPTKSSMTIDALTSGSKAWVRVCANATAGAGPFSDPATIVVP